MTTLTYYCAAADMRRLLGLAVTDISDADCLELIKLAQDEVDKFCKTVFLPVQASGTATSGNVTTITDTGAAWTIDEWNANADLTEGYAAWIYSGTNSGQVRTIIDNTATALTVSPAFSSAIDNTSKYRIIKNTYTNETFDGDGTDTMFLDESPLLSLISLTIDSTLVTASTIYSTGKNAMMGKLQLSASSNVTYFKDTYPLLCNAKYYYGVFPVPVLIKELCALYAAIMGAEYKLGASYTFASSYTMPDLSVTKGNPLPHFDRLLKSLSEKRDWLEQNLLKQFMRPRFG